MDVFLPGGAGHADFAGPVAGEEQVEVIVADRAGLVMGGGGGELFVEHAPVAGETAAPPPIRNHTLFGNEPGEHHEGIIDPQVRGGTGWVHRGFAGPNHRRQHGGHIRCHPFRSIHHGDSGHPGVFQGDNDAFGAGHVVAHQGDLPV